MFVPSYTIKKRGVYKQHKPNDIIKVYEEYEEVELLGDKSDPQNFIVHKKRRLKNSYSQKEYVNSFNADCDINRIIKTMVAQYGSLENSPTMFKASQAVDVSNVPLTAGAQAELKTRIENSYNSLPNEVKGLRKHEQTVADFINSLTAEDIKQALAEKLAEKQIKKELKEDK